MRRSSVYNIRIQNTPDNGKHCLNQFMAPDNLKYLRYESSTLILYKELSSSIFQSCEWVSESGIRDTCPYLHFVQYIKAYMPSTDPVSSITAS